MPIDLEKLERLAAQATHLPWKVWERDDRYIVDASGKRELARVSMRYKPYPERAEYIAAACNAVPELIAENRALQEKVQALEERIQELTQLYPCTTIDFPQLRASVAGTDNSLSDFLNEAIKRAAHRP